MNRRWAVIAPTLALIAVACNPGASPSPSGGAPSPTDAPSGSAPPSASASATAEKCTGQELSFQLSFIPNVQHAGFLVAHARGFYEDEGLAVEMIPAGPNVDPVSAVGDGTASLGQVDYGQLLRARQAGVPIVSIAQTYKETFLNWYASADSGIDTMADWQGKRVGRTQVGDDPEIIAMLASADLTLDDITTIQQDFGIDEFVAGEVDLATGVVFFHPAAFNGQTDMTWPDDFNIFVPEENGANIASQTVATTEEMIQQDPAALRCFLRASIRGWQAVFDDTELAVDDVMTFIPEGAIPREHQSPAMLDVLPIIGSGPDDNLLQIDPAQYEETIQVLEGVEFIEPGLAAADTYDTSIYDSMGPVTAP
jgi:NitT/TauT family transport system substrate-binding protein